VRFVVCHPTWDKMEGTTTINKINIMIHNINKHRGGFTLVEIMIVVAIIALLAAIAVPGFLRARKRSQATTLLNDLRLIDSAKDQYATEYLKVYVQPVGNDLKGYFKNGSVLYNAAAKDMGTGIVSGRFSGVTYYLNDSNTLPSINAAGAYSDVCDSTFWSPYLAQ